MERRRVLLVEDNQRLSEVIQLFLSEVFEVKWAATGAEAIAIVRREPVAAVLLDYRLPDRTGLEVLAEIRSAWPRLPVIMMTGYGSEMLVASAIKLGVSDYFSKPVNVEDILQSLQRVLSAPGHSEEPPAEKHGSPSHRSPGNVPDLSIQRMMKLIQVRAGEHVSLSGLARELGISKYHLSHRFKETVGVTFRRYLLQARLERAEALLADEQLSITDVALMAGFNDLARFDKLFKRHTGLTPSAYRARRLGPSDK